MQNFIAYRRPAQWLAIVAGAILTVATVKILAEEALRTGTWTQDQWLALVILAATNVFGWISEVAREERRWGRAFAFGLMFLAGTALTVYTSVGRQHGSKAKAEVAVQTSNTKLHDLQKDVERAQAEYDELHKTLASWPKRKTSIEIGAALAAIVGNGPDKVPVHVWKRTNGCAADQISRPDSAAACKPALDLRIEQGAAIGRERVEAQFREAGNALSTARAELKSYGGEQIVTSKAKPFAEFMALLGANEARTEQMASMVEPLLYTLFLEIGIILSFGFGFAPTPSVEIAEPKEPNTEKPAEPAQLPRTLGRAGRKADPNVVSFVEAHRARHGRNPSAEELASRFPSMPRSTRYWYTHLGEEKRATA